MAEFEYSNPECNFNLLATKEKPCWGEVEIVDDYYDNESGEAWEVYACMGHADMSYRDGKYNKKDNSSYEHFSLFGMKPSDG